MNFSRSGNVNNFALLSRTQVVRDTILTIFLCVCLIGCSDSFQPVTSEQLREFKMAGPSRPSVDMERLVKAKIGGGEYQIVSGDVLELTMPVILQVVTDEGGGRFEQSTPYICRVHEDGNVTLPIVGQIEAAGRTLSQIESDITDAYYPEYVITIPTVFARVLEYKTAKVSITGAVQKPGIYSLRSDQMSLVALLMEAEGIIDDGASVIRINRLNKEIPISKKAITNPPDLNRKKEVKFTSQYPGSDEVNIQLYFQQEAPASTIGLLTIRQDEKQLFFDQIDLTDKGERLLLLDRLGCTEPHISIVDVEQKLNELTDSIKADFIKHNNVYRVADHNIGLSGLLTVYSALQENLAQAESQVPNTSLEKRLSPDAKRKLLEYRQSTRDRQKQEILNNGKSSIRDFSVNDKGTEPRQKPRSKRIISQDTLQETEKLILPIKGLNIPFVDVVLQDGDSVIVERLEPSLVTVMGLVNKPGNFPYPPDARYNLVQALAFAGGLNEVADPRYVTVHRLKSDGAIVSAVFPIIDGSRLTDAANTPIKPGDIVHVEHTPRTRTAVFLDRIFRINIGTYLRLEDTWE